LFYPLSADGAESVVYTNFVMYESIAKLFNDTENVVFTHDQALNTIELNLGPSVFSKNHRLANFYLKRSDLTVVRKLAGTNSDNYATSWFFFSAIGKKEQSALAFCWLLLSLYKDSIIKWTNVHILNLLNIGINDADYSYVPLNLDT